MIRIDEISVRKVQYSKLNNSKIEKVLKSKLKKVASATYFVIKQKEWGMEVILTNHISLQTANQICNAFSAEGIEIKKVVWEPIEVGDLKKGSLEIIVS